MSPVSGSVFAGAETRWLWEWLANTDGLDGRERRLLYWHLTNTPGCGTIRQKYSSLHRSRVKKGDNIIEKKSKAFLSSIFSSNAPPFLCYLTWCPEFRTCDSFWRETHFLFILRLVNLRKNIFTSCFRCVNTRKCKKTFFPFTLSH